MKSDSIFKKQLMPSRLPQRATTDLVAIKSVLDETMFCTLSFSKDSQPFSITTGFCILKDKLYVHGSTKSHFLQQLMSKEVCISTFLFDGLVLAGSAFNHSVNYRSVICFSVAEAVNDNEVKLEALKKFTNRYIPGRWNELRPTTEGELKGTTVISFNLEKASLKERKGPPSFSDNDYYKNLWTGVIPAVQSWGTPIPDPKMNPEIGYPDYFG